MIKEHFEKHQKIYWVGSLIVVAGVTYYVSRGRITQGGMTNAASFIFRNNQTITNAVDRQGPPSWIIENIDTHERWLSQRAAAIANGHRESQLSAHLNGLTDEINGKVYRRLGLAIA